MTAEPHSPACASKTTGSYVPRDFSKPIQERLEAIGLAGDTWSLLKTAPIMEIVFADDIESSTEHAKLASMYSGPERAFVNRLHDRATRLAALDLLRDVLDELPPEEGVKLREDVGRDIGRFLQGRSWQQWAAKAGDRLRKAFLREFSEHERQALRGITDRLGLKGVLHATLTQNPFLQSSLSDFMALEPPIQSSPVSEVTPTICTFAAAPEVPCTTERDDSPCRLSAWLWEAISPSRERVAGICSLVERSRDLIVKESTSGGFSLEGVKTLSDLLAIESTVALWDAGVGYLPSIATAGKDVYIVGDLHGDFASLTAVIRKTAFFDNANVVLVFLGDYVDRGEGTIPVLLRVLEMKLAHPNRVILLRGNHDGIQPCRSAKGAPLENSRAGASPEGWMQNSPADENPHCSLLAGVDKHLSPLFAAKGAERWAAHWLLKDIFDHLPVCLFLHDGTFLTHGGILPRRPDQIDPNERLPGGYSAREARGTIADGLEKRVAVRGIADLRKRDVQKFMVEMRIEAKPFGVMLWVGEECRGFDFGDVKAFFSITGATQMLRGHDPYPCGYKEYPECPGVYTLHTTRSLDNAGFRCIPHIARWRPSEPPESVKVEKADA